MSIDAYFFFGRIVYFFGRIDDFPARRFLQDSE